MAAIARVYGSTAMSGGTPRAGPSAREVDQLAGVDHRGRGSEIRPGFAVAIEMVDPATDSLQGLGHARAGNGSVRESQPQVQRLGCD